MTQENTENTRLQNVLSRAGTALNDERVAGLDTGLENEERHALQRVVGVATDRSGEKQIDVEYRQLRLERVILVGLWTKGSATSAENSLRELAALADTAGAVVLDALLQHRALPDPATFIGSGKAKELAELVAASGADTVVVDDCLQPSQRRALEDIVKVKVIDRTALILDIFAQHAKSREGKAQIELAQLEYLLPRLRGWGDSMSRQAGGRAAGGEGIGSRGPGETKIELDRRRIRTKMAKLRKQIAQMAASRLTKRAQRRRNKIPSVALVGYTNAGKSSILNALTGAGVLVENQLFATLDPTVRQAATSDGRIYTLADTVGFVRRLPTQLVEAFRSTLEEALEADVLVHVVDATHDDPLAQVAAVRQVLSEVEDSEQLTTTYTDADNADSGAWAKVAKIETHGETQQKRGKKIQPVEKPAHPEIIVLNKVDAVDELTLATLRSRLPGAVLVSAATGEGLVELEEKIAALLPYPQIELEGTIPFTRGDLVARLHSEAEILSLSYGETGTFVRVRVDADLAGALRAVGLQAASELVSGAANELGAGTPNDLDDALADETATLRLNTALASSRLPLETSLPESEADNG